MTYEIISSLKSRIIRWPRHLLMAGGLCLLVACGGGGGGASTSATYTAPTAPDKSLIRTDGGAAVNPGFEATFVVVFSYGTGKLIADDGTPEKSVVSGQSITVRPTKTTIYTLIVSYQNPETVRPDIRQVPTYLTVYVNTLADIFPKPAEVILTPDFSTIASPGTVNLTLTYPTPVGLDVVSTGILINGVLDTSFTGVIKSGEQATYSNLRKDTAYALEVTYRDTRNALNPTATIPSSPKNIVVTSAGSFGLAPEMNIARSDFSATFIANKGQVLVCGGVSSNGTILSSCEIYDSNLRTWTLTPNNMSTPRRGHAATLLYGGSHVLISGGYTTGALTTSKTTDIYDSGSRYLAAGPALIEARSGHSSILLSNQKVLIFGGAVSSGNGTAAELVTFDAKGKATTAPTGSLNAPRQDYTATSLPTGEVLVTGRTDGGTPAYNSDGKLVNSKSFEIYDETAGTWSLGSVAMKVGRSNHAASLLPYDEATRSPLQILISGGSGIAASGTSEVLKRVITTTAGVTSVAWTTSTSATPMLNPRSFHTSTTLSSGDVLLIGGKGPDAFSTDLDTTDTYLSTETTPKFDDSNTQKKLNYARSMHKSVLLSNDSVLVLGNYFKDQGKADNKAELWSPPAP